MTAAPRHPVHRPAQQPPASPPPPWLGLGAVLLDVLVAPAASATVEPRRGCGVLATLALAVLAFLLWRRPRR